jgi:hypothetical protein
MSASTLSQTKHTPVHYAETSVPQGCANLPTAEVWAWAFRTGHSIGATDSGLVAALQPFAALLEQVAARDLVDDANVTCQVSVGDIRLAHAAVARVTGAAA